MSAFLNSSNPQPHVLSILFSNISLVLLSTLFSYLNISSISIWVLIYPLSVATFFPIILRGASSDATTLLESEAISKIRKEGFALLPSLLGSSLLLKIERFMLPIFAGTGALGTYVAVATMMDAADWPIRSWIGTKLNDWGRLRDDDYFVLPWRLIIQVILVAMGLSLAAGLLTWAIVIFILHPSYQGSLPLLPVLAISTVFLSASNLSQGYLTATGAPQLVSKISLVGIGVLVASAPVLMPAFGALGAAFGVAFSRLTMAAIGIFYIYKK